ncbi:MAG TPA: hypothetical protein VKQ08_10670 [Cyclobacteriaceae bacterium]|nr:hypothetical protein [Cyclobacteriaceae bacterium]
MKPLIIFLLMVLTSPLFAQDKSLPYYEIPGYPETFTAGAVASRLIDGLGFRFYWATEGLRSADLSYRPNDEARTSLETIEHIYGLSKMILYSTKQKEKISEPNAKLSFAGMRKAVLQNLKAASEKLLVSSDQDLKDFKIMLNGQEYPFWNQLNGPIADCLWHVGQVVSFRRSSGNPFSGKVEVFTGTVEK